MSRPPGKMTCATEAVPAHSTRYSNSGKVGFSFFLDSWNECKKLHRGPVAEGIQKTRRVSSFATLMKQFAPLSRQLRCTKKAPKSFEIEATNRGCRTICCPAVWLYQSRLHSPPTFNFVIIKLECSPYCREDGRKSNF